MNLVYISLPIISAFIGWLTNHFAITMIFRPHKPFGFGPFKVQGLLARRKKDLALKIASTIESELISHDDVMAALSDEKALEDFKGYLGDRLDSFLTNKLGEINPMLSAFLNDEIRAKLRTLFFEELDSNMPELLEMFSERLENSVNFQEIIEARIDELDLDQAEKLIREVTSKELVFIEWFGAILGFMIGIVQVGIILLQK